MLYPEGQRDMAEAVALALGAGECEALGEQTDETAETEGAAAAAESLQVILGPDYRP